MRPESNTSVILTPELIQSCVDILRPGVERFVSSLATRNAIYLVVLDPVHIVSPQVAWEGAIGEQDQTKWNGTYAKNATTKAFLSFRTKESSHIVQIDQPYHFTDGDFKFGGSIYHQGIVVGASGLSQEHDFMIAAALAVLIHGQCRAKMVDILKVSNDPDKYYFPERL